MFQALAGSPPHEPNTRRFNNAAEGLADAFGWQSFSLGGHALRQARVTAARSRRPHIGRTERCPDARVDLEPWETRRVKAVSIA